MQLDSGMKLTIVGAHFPHGAETGDDGACWKYCSTWRGWYGEYLGVLRYNVAMSRKVTEKVVLLADSNAGLHQKSAPGLRFRAVCVPRGLQLADCDRGGLAACQGANYVVQIQDSGRCMPLETAGPAATTWATMAFMTESCRTSAHL